MSETHRITFDPYQCGGRPCLRGLRIRVRDVPDLLAWFETILPDIVAALERGER